ncbi:MAG: Ppx/GppA family phosphatase [Bdellovibrionia bacterium]
MKRVAALDLGTNTFILLILEKADNGHISTIVDEVRTVRLGQELDQTKSLHPDALGRAENCLNEFSQIIKAHNVHQVRGVATSAARDAKNGDELFKIAERYQIPIDIISGNEEARVSFLGSTYGHLQGDESVAVIDIGGGSTEIIIGTSKQIAFGKSFDVGGVRMTERYIHVQPVKETEIKQLEKALDEGICKELQAVSKAHNPSRMLAVAGTPTAIAAVQLGGFDTQKVDGYFLSLNDLRKWHDVFGKTTIEEKQEKYKLSGRADIIFAGITILIKVVETFGMDGVYVSTKGVRYGLALDMLS